MPKDPQVLTRLSRTSSEEADLNESTLSEADGIDEGGFEEHPHRSKVEVNQRRLCIILGAIAAGVALIVALGFVFGLLVVGGRTIDTSNRVVFAVIGDFGREGIPDQLAVAHQMGVTCERYHCSYIVGTGDNFYPNGVHNSSDPQFRTSWSNVYTAASLQIPWYMLAGNHDYRLDVDAQIGAHADRPLWRFPSHYYTARLTSAFHDLPFGAEVVMLDTVPLVPRYRTEPTYAAKLANQSEAAQLEWIDQVLSQPREHPGDWRFVVGHHPIYSAANDHVYEDQIALQMSLRPLLNRYNVSLYLAGHEHTLEALRNPSDTPLYIVSGAGSTVRNDRNDSLPAGQFLQYYDATPGFALVLVGLADTEVLLIDAAGNTLRRDVLLR
jgi:hypothetical protein